MDRLMGASIDNAENLVIHLLFADDCFITTQAILHEVKIPQQVIE